MSTLDQVLEIALQLPYEQQEMLIKILQNRHHESRRAEIAADAQQSLAGFHADKFQPQSAEDVVTALRHSLQDIPSQQPERKRIIKQMKGLLKTNQPAPTDEQVKAMLEDRRVDKYLD